MAETLAALNILRRAKSVNKNRETSDLYRSILSYLNDHCKNRKNQYFERLSNSNVDKEKETTNYTKNSPQTRSPKTEKNSSKSMGSNNTETTKSNNSDIGSTGDSSNTSERVNITIDTRNSKTKSKEYLEELDKLPSVQPLNTNKTTKVFNNISEEDMGYICKSIHDVKEDYDYTDVKDALIDQFIIASSSFYQGETVGQLINGLLAVQATLLEQCVLFGLVGAMADIHTTLFAFDLLKFDSVALYSYCRLFFIQLGKKYYDAEIIREMEFDEQDHLNLAIAALYGKFAFLERCRINSHVYDVLFTDPDTRQVTFNGSLMFYDVETSDVIIGRGPDYYYPRCGTVTIADIANRFSPQDTLFSLAQFQKGRYIASSANTHDDLAARLIRTVWERRADDPRTFITPIGPKLMVNTPEWNTLLSLNEDVNHSYNDIQDRCTSEGICVKGRNGGKRELNNLFHDYIVANLCEDFTTSCEGNRDYREVSSGVYVDVDTFIDHSESDELRTDVLFFGGRNGNSKYYVYTYGCLARTWNKYKLPVAPHDITVEFPIRPLRRLCRLLQYECKHPDAEYLGQILTSILWPEQYFIVPPLLSEYVSRLAKTQDELGRIISAKYTQRRISNILIHLQNLARYLQHWDDDGPITLFHQRGFRKDDFGGKHANMAMAITRIIYTLQNTPEFLDLRIVRLEVEVPSNIKGVQLSDESLRALNSGKTQNYIPKDLGMTYYVEPDGTKRKPRQDDEVEEKHYFTFEIEGDAPTLGKYLTMLVFAFKYGIDAILKRCPTILFPTIEKYSRDLLGESSINALLFEVENPSFRVVKESLQIEIEGRPKLLNFLTGDTVEVDEDNEFQIFAGSTFTP